MSNADLNHLENDSWDEDLESESYDDVRGNFLDTFSHFEFEVSEDAYYNNPWFDCLDGDEAVAAWENTQ